MSVFTFFLWMIFTIVIVVVVVVVDDDVHDRYFLSLSLCRSVLLLSRLRCTLHMVTCARTYLGVSRKEDNGRIITETVTLQKRLIPIITYHPHHLYMGVSKKGDNGR